jgi:hypothetical protein
LANGKVALGDALKLVAEYPRDRDDLDTKVWSLKTVCAADGRQLGLSDSPLPVSASIYKSQCIHSKAQICGLKKDPARIADLKFLYILAMKSHAAQRAEFLYGQCLEA